MALKIATLGAAGKSLQALGKLLDFEWEHIDADMPTPDGAPHQADVLLGMVYGAEEARKVTFRMMQLQGAGLDKIDWAVVPKSAWVCNLFGHEVPMAEYCVSALLNADMDWAGMVAHFRDKPWAEAYASRPRRAELFGKTVAIVGFGHIGKEVACRLQPFGVRIIGIASKARPAELGAEWIRGPEAMAQVAAEADFIVLSAPLSDETRGLVSASVLQAMKPDAYIVNVGRGGLIDEAALFEALQSGGIRGACLDTWYHYPAGADDTRPPSSYPFASLPNVVATAHNSAWSHGLPQRRQRLLADNLAAFAAGRPLSNVVQSPS